MNYRYHHFYLPIARFVNRLSPIARAAVTIAQILLILGMVAFELSKLTGGV